VTEVRVNIIKKTYYVSKKQSVLKDGKEEKIFGSEREQRLSDKGIPSAFLLAKISDITWTKKCERFKFSTFIYLLMYRMICGTHF
jgi:hypothetical protein